MKNTKLAVAVGAGYLLGRMHKARWALGLAALAAGKRLSTSGGGLLEGLMDSSPQLRELAGTVRGDLADAGRKAVVSAAGRRIDALTERLESGTSALRDDSGSGKRGSRGESEEPEEPEDETEEDEELDEDKGARAAARRPRSQSKTSSTRSRGRSPAKSTAAKARGGAAAKKTARTTTRKLAS